MVSKLFPKGLKKAFTLSYDDGVSQDKRLVQLFNRYNLKSTFNINSGIQSEKSTWLGKNNVKIHRMNIDEIATLYLGHEVAVHSLTHPRLDLLTPAKISHELLEDKRNLETLFGYPVVGMAYPYGTYSNSVKDVMKMLGLSYSRTVEDTLEFSLPTDFLEWHPTCHHANPKLMKLSEEFVDKVFEDLSVFYVWGHSYEFDENNNWELIESFCDFIANKKDIWYAKNVEIYNYIKAHESLIYSADESIAFNPSAYSLWVEVNQRVVEIRPGETVKL